jgi:hypothetical protein
MFGFYVSRPFYLRSRLPSRRTVEVVGGKNLVLRTTVRNKVSQQFYYDGKTKTIKSVQYKDKSIDIQ